MLIECFQLVSGGGNFRSDAVSGGSLVDWSNMVHHSGKGDDRGSLAARDGSGGQRSFPLALPPRRGRGQSAQGLVKALTSVARAPQLLFDRGAPLSDDAEQQLIDSPPQHLRDLAGTVELLNELVPGDRHSGLNTLQSGSYDRLGHGFALRKGWRGKRSFHRGLVWNPYGGSGGGGRLRRHAPS